jgi:hypothetical protein
MWDPRRLTTPWAFTACYRDSLAFYYLNIEPYMTSYGPEILSLKVIRMYVHLHTSSPKRCTDIENKKIEVAREERLINIAQD